MYLKTLEECQKIVAIRNGLGKSLVTGHQSTTTIITKGNLLILCPNCHQEEHFLNKDGIFTENKIRVASLPG